MMESKAGRQTIVLLAGDWLALGLFVFLGQVDHDVVGLPRLLSQTAMLAMPWTVIALLLNAYWLTETTTLRVFLNRGLVAWLIAAPLALLLRALIQGQSVIAVPFMIITMGLGGLFLLGWRAAFYLIRARRQPAS